GSPVTFQRRISQRARHRPRRPEGANNNFLVLRAGDNEASNENVVAGLHWQPGGNIGEDRGNCLHFEGADVGAIAAGSVSDSRVIGSTRETGATLVCRQLAGQTRARAFVDSWASGK